MTHSDYNHETATSASKNQSMEFGATAAADNASRAVAQQRPEFVEFMGLVTHDLKEPLRKMSSFVGLLKEDLADNLDESGREMMEFIVDGAHRAQELIGDLNYFASIDSLDPQASEVSLIDLMEDLEFVLRQEEHADALRLEYAALPTLTTDKAMLHRIFEELLSNADKYRAKGQSMVSIRASQAANRIQIEVEDSGIGIEEEHFALIFEPLKRMYSRANYPGNGMGLAVARKLARRLGGELVIVSSSQAGSKFRMDLPVHYPRTS